MGGGAQFGTGLKRGKDRRKRDKITRGTGKRNPNADNKSKERRGLQKKEG